MKSLILALACLISGSSVFAASPVAISVTKSIRYAIPAQGTSCYSAKTAVEQGRTAEPDISAAYFSIPTVAFSVADNSRDTYISAIRVTYKTPNGVEKTCAFGGEQLSALSTQWWANNKVSVIKANSSDADKVTDCALLCGGVDVDSENFTATGTIKVYGYTENPRNADDSQGFSAATTFEFGSQH